MALPQGVHAFMRAYYHFKSADWKPNKPFVLSAETATNTGRCRATTSWISTGTWRETVAEAMPTAAEIAACRWMTEDEMKVFSTEYERNGFQGGLQQLPRERGSENRQRDAHLRGEDD